VILLSYSKPLHFLLFFILKILFGSCILYLSIFIYILL